MVDSLVAVLEEFRGAAPEVEAAGERLAACLRGGGKILACGNGGSAADALHFCEELTGRYRESRPALPALCLNADGTALTCIANDFGFAEVFARQVAAFGRPGDVLVAFSTSGNSPNILRALEEAAGRGIDRILLSGRTGGRAAGLAAVTVPVPSGESARIQEVHSFVLHSWVERIEAELFGTGGERPAAGRP